MTQNVSPKPRLVGVGCGRSTVVKSEISVRDDRRWREVGYADGDRPRGKGKILWQQKTEDPLIGGVLATAGGLVFRISGGGEGRCGASSSSDFFRFSRLVRA